MIIPPPAMAAKGAKPPADAPNREPSSKKKAKGNSKLHIFIKPTIVY